MKLIFLDIDGVLNGFLLKKPAGTDTTGPIIFPELANRLQAIIGAVGEPMIVLSTSWRLKYSLPVWNGILTGFGITAPVIGRTPLTENASREMEIAVALNNYKPTKYLILDDVPMEILKEYAVKTSSLYGLSDEDVIRAIEILKVN